MAENRTVFGNTCSKSAHPENESTEALRYILGKSKAATLAFRRFVNDCGCDIPSISWFESQPVSQEGGTPDLSCLDGRGETRVLVENKFWAGLTDNQPVAYLKLLPKDLESLLLFVVPEARRNLIWDQLTSRCQSAGIKLSSLSSSPAVTSAVVSKRHRLAVTGWHTLLGKLEDALLSADERSTASDVAQLRGLCEAMDAQAFLPLRADELSDQTVPRRIIDYSNLVREIANAAIQERVCKKDGLLPTHGWYSAGQYLKLGRFGMWLGVEAESWARWGASPVWCYFSRGTFGKANLVRELLHGWNGRSLQRAYEEDDGSVIVPIILKNGVEKEEITKSAVEQLRVLHKLLNSKRRMRH